jgi:hypothetical protein
MWGQCLWGRGLVGLLSLDGDLLPVTVMLASAKLFGGYAATALLMPHLLLLLLLLLQVVTPSVSVASWVSMCQQVRRHAGGGGGHAASTAALPCWPLSRRMASTVGQYDHA